jgi:hypothetical protein
VRLLSPLRVLRELGLDHPREPFALLVRAADGAAVVLAVDDADAHVRRIAKARKSSLIQSISGPSTWFALPHSQRRWRLTAAGPHLLWLGDDAAVTLLADARQGRTPRLLQDPALADRLQELRAAGPVWAMVADADGFDRWLPSGAQRHHVRAATAVLQGEPVALTVQFDCKGTEGAAALHDRLDSWIADNRRRAEDPLDARQRAVAQQLSNLAVLVAKTAEASARLLPIGSTDHQTLLSSSTQAMQLARETAPGILPATPSTATQPDSLLAAIQPPALASVEARGTAVHWRFQGEVAALLAVLALPSAAGLDPVSPAERGAITSPAASPPPTTVRDLPPPAAPAAGVPTVAPAAVAPPSAVRAPSIPTVAPTPSLPPAVAPR